MAVDYDSEMFKLNLRRSVDNLGDEPARDRKSPLIDLVCAYRLLLGRNPVVGQETDNLAWLAETMTLGQFLSHIKKSDEFEGIVNPNTLLMAELPEFRFWFNTSDTEMGLRMGFGRYEPETMDVMKKVVKPGMCCWDIGAQTGFYTCLMSTLVGEKGTVIAYEPMPSSFALVEKNISENDFGRVATAFNAACSDQAGSLSMQLVSGMFIAGAGVRDAETFSVDMVRLDDQKHKAPDLIKIDVEGHEPAVLSGLERTIERKKPLLLMELNEYWLKTCSASSSNAIVRRLIDLGYICEDIDEGGDLDGSFSQLPGESRNILARPG